jgi:fructose-1,6-bisphosphatase
VYGELQLDGDLLTEKIIFGSLQKASSVFGAVSEETP